MSILTGCHTEGAAIFACAQAGCSQCLEYLLRQNSRLIHSCIHYEEIGGVDYEDLVQEGRLALWGAIRRYDPERGTAFSTYAWAAITYQIRRYTHRICLNEVYLEEEPLEHLAELAEAHWLEVQIHQALNEGLEALPEQLRRVLCLVYGLAGEEPHPLKEVGQQMGLGRGPIGRLRNQAVAQLRLPALSIRLRGLCDQDSRQAYRQARRLNDTWLGRRRVRR
jgi:RNA polymerase sigma factor (sigma-70 family)